jgi:hypothetical protein
LFRWLPFTAGLARRRDFRIDLFHGQLIETLIFRAFPEIARNSVES